MATKKIVKDDTVTVDHGAVLARTKEIEREVATVATKLAQLPKELEDEEDYKLACELLVDVVEKRKWIDDERDGFMEDVKRLAARVEGWFAKAYEQIDTVETYWRVSIANYAKALDAKATALRTAAAKLPARDEERARELLLEAEELVPPKVGGISITTKEAVEIVNEKHLPEKFFKRVVDEKLLLAALCRGETVPGARLVVHKSVRVTPTNAKKEA